jgi:methylamine---glutamate N-methyltransferase subunit A
MCGIVGLLIKRPEQRELLGQWIAPMLVCMGARGPDSAGLATFAPATDDSFRLSLFAHDEQYSWNALASSLARAGFPVHVQQAQGRHAVFGTQRARLADLKAWLAAHAPAVHILSAGHSIAVYKDEGTPAELTERYQFAKMTGSHAVGHTRMATESAVSPLHAHPFTAGADFCLVHNGSLSNHHSLRRMLERRGVRFETDNDTEAACRFLEWRMREGDDLETALEGAFVELDGFYTLLMATADKLVLVRDAFACKPAVVAESDDYVAIASEFRGLAGLPGVREARLFEPMPQEIYSWSV